VKVFDWFETGCITGFPLTYKNQMKPVARWLQLKCALERAGLLRFGSVHAGLHDGLDVRLAGAPAGHDAVCAGHAKPVSLRNLPDAGGENGLHDSVVVVSILLLDF